MKTLFIDTANNTEITVRLVIDTKEDTVTLPIDNRKAQVVLPLISELLKKHTLTPKDLDGIAVNIGPGSFTGLRVGAAIANTLGSILQIPINGKKVGELVEPDYTYPPKS